MEKVITKIRDILRKEGLTGMDSINHCIAFVVCRLLDAEICEKLGIPTSCMFDNIMKGDDGKEIGEQELFDRFGSRTPTSFMYHLTYTLHFTNMKFKIKGIQNLKLIMKQLQKLDIDNLAINYDIIGTIYEYHLKTGSTSAMRDLGQYYTHRLVIKYMVELCNIQMMDGVIEKIVDPTMGTGGFLTMAIKYLNAKYPGAIDWKKNNCNIIGFDLDENVRNMALLNVLLEIKELCTDTLVKQDTLGNDMTFANGTLLQKANVILANEPMGIKNIIHANCCERIVKMKLRGTKAEPLFLQLFMEALDDGGRCAVIVPDGVLFNESKLHKSTRAHLLDNFNLKKVIALNDDNFFLNTGVKTSILFFTNEETKTTDVQFCEISIGEGERLIENEIVKVPIDKIRELEYSLFVNKYNAVEIVKHDGIEYKKLGEICEFLPKSKRKASDGKDSGPYPFYTSSSKIQRCDAADYEDECIIIGTGGNANIKCNNHFSCSSDNFVLKTTEQNIKYIYHYLSNNITRLENGFSGSTIKHLSKKYVANLEIPVPSLKVQKKIVKRLDILSKNNETLRQNIDEFKKIMMYYVDTKTQHCINQSNLKMLLKNIKTGKNKPSDNKTGTKYPYYGTGKITGYTDEYLFDGEYLLTPRNGTIGTVLHTFGKIFPSDHMFVLEFNPSENIKYMYYYISNCIDLDSKKHGTTIPNITSKDIKNSVIPLPPKEVQQEIVNYCDNLSNMITSMEQQIFQNDSLMKLILENYLTIKRPIPVVAAAAADDGDLMILKADAEMS